MTIEIRKRRRRSATIAMADIAFLLLIFLVVTASIDENNEIDIPRFAYARKAGYTRTVTVAIDREGRVLMDGRELKAERLGAWLAARSAGSAGLIVRVMADAAVPYRYVDNLLASLKGQAITKVILVAEKEHGGR